MSNDPTPMGKYKPAARFGDLIFTAGMTPRKDGELIDTGKLSILTGLDPGYHKRAVCLAAENALTAAENCLKEGEYIAQILSLTVYINAEPRYSQHPKMADFASEYLAEKLGPEAGIGARAAVGVSSLPGEATFEVQLIAGVGRKAE